MPIHIQKRTAGHQVTVYAMHTLSKDTSNSQALGLRVSLQQKKISEMLHIKVQALTGKS
jgi:hypothetical protein